MVRAQLPAVRLHVARREGDAGVGEEPAEDLRHRAASGPRELEDQAAVADAELERGRARLGAGGQPAEGRRPLHAQADGMAGWLAC